jgi:hypothetical protein
VSTISSISLFKQADKYKRLVQAKLYSFPVIEHYYASSNPDHQKYAERILNCSNDINIRFSSEITPEGIEAYTSIEGARWCRVRQCPLCQFARVSKQRARLFKGFAGKDLSTQDYIFLTLTIRNIPLNQLRESLSQMTKAWNKMHQRRTFPSDGFLRSMEVTMERECLLGDKNKNTGPPIRSADGQLKAHPHFHCLLRMKDGYFTDDFKKVMWWVEQWQSALGVDYGPSVSIRKVRPDKDQDFAKALLETIKYTVKPSDFGFYPESSEWLLGITEQLHRLRSLSIGGSFSEICSQKELDKIEDTCGSSEEIAQTGTTLKLSWNDRARNYDVFQPVIGD